MGERIAGVGAVLLLLAPTARADRWLIFDPMPDRPTAERFAEFVTGKVILIPPYLIHVRQAVARERQPKSAPERRRFTIEVEQDALFTADLIPGQQDRDGGTAFYTVRLKGECGEPSLEPMPQFAAFEELPESFSVLRDGVFRGLPEALAAEMPEIARKFYPAVPWRLPEPSLARVEECRRQFLQKAERHPIESVEVYEGAQRRLVLRQHTTWWSVALFDLGEDWSPSRFVVRLRTGADSDVAMEVRKGDRWIALERQGDAHLAGSLHRSLICLPPAADEPARRGVASESLCPAGAWGRVEYRVRFRSQPVKGLAFQHSWD